MIMRNMIIITVLFGVFGGCTPPKHKDFVFDEFMSQIEGKFIIDSIDNTGLIYLSQGEKYFTISLDDMRKNYERDKDKSHISDLVGILLHPLLLPEEWADAKNDIYVLLFPNDFEFEDIIHVKITDEFSKIYIHRSKGQLTWITKDIIANWNITEFELESYANNNADKLLEQIPILVDIVDNRKLGIIDAEPEYMTLFGAFLFAPSMREKVKSDFGFPFYAVIPVRDFCYIFSEQDFDFFATKSNLGEVVISEYTQSGYPITTEILKFTDDGVEVAGKYAIE